MTNRPSSETAASTHAKSPYAASIRPMGTWLGLWLGLGLGFGLRLGSDRWAPG